MCVVCILCVVCIMCVLCIMCIVYIMCVECIMCVVCIYIVCCVYNVCSVCIICRVYSYIICILCSSSYEGVGAVSVHIIINSEFFSWHWNCSGMYITSTVNLKHGRYLPLSIGRRRD